MPQHLNWNWQLQRTCTLGMMSTCGYTNLCILWRCCALFASVCTYESEATKWMYKCSAMSLQFRCLLGNWQASKLLLETLGTMSSHIRWAPAWQVQNRKDLFASEMEQPEACCLSYSFLTSFSITFSQHKSFKGNRNQLTNSRGYGDLKNQTTWTVQLKQVPCHLRWWRLSM